MLYAIQPSAALPALRAGRISTVAKIATVAYSPGYIAG